MFTESININFKKTNKINQNCGLTECIIHNWRHGSFSEEVLILARYKQRIKGLDEEMYKTILGFIIFADFRIYWGCKNNAT